MANPGAPGAGSANAPGTASARDLEQYITQGRLSFISWHTMLNNNVSTRPNQHGGKLCHAVTACNTFTKNAPGTASAWRCTLELPNRFAPGDGMRARTIGEWADERACLRGRMSQGCGSSVGGESRAARVATQAWRVPIQTLVDRIGPHQAG